MSPHLPQQSCTLKPEQAFHALEDAGEAKLSLGLVQHFSAAVMGGILVGGYAHCSTVGASTFLEWMELDGAHPDPGTVGIANLIFAIIFSGAFAGIVATGADLFTSNVSYITTLLLRDKSRLLSLRSWIRIIRMFTVSYLGNAIGCAGLAAFTFGIGCDQFFKQPDDYDIGDVPDFNWTMDHHHEMLCHMAGHKTSLNHPVWSFFCNAVGCNVFVTIATWKTKYSQDAWGQYVGAAMPVLAFCVGGFQHVVANMFTLAAGLYVGCHDLTVFNVIVRNIIPVTAGNVVGGMVMAFVGHGMYPTRPKPFIGDIGDVDMFSKRSKSFTSHGILSSKEYPYSDVTPADACHNDRIPNDQPPVRTEMWIRRPAPSSHPTTPTKESNGHDAIGINREGC